MACTTQSAFVYVEKARSRLLGKLKNLSVILENLRQKEVFSDEAVSKIQAEKDDYDKTRKILDWVKCKGEDACYELLRIVDMTRQRTLEVDLHHWISCFPFREDAQMDTNYLQGPKPCHRYQAKLKLKARKTSNEFWMANKYLFEENNKPDLSYMSLVLDTQGRVSPSKTKKLKSKKSKMIRPKKLRTYVPEDKVGISPGDLLKTYRDVLVVGKPGIGKTALTQEMLKLWAERDNEKLDYMFYFDMRETSHITKAVSLEDLLFNMFSEPDEGKEEVLQDIKNNSDNVTLIFDGMTDLSSSVVKRLVEKDLLPDAKIIVTCRQDDEEEFSSEDFLRVEVKGFSEQTIKAYLAEMLGKEQKKVFSNVELLTLCHVPIYALMVAACFSFETPEDSPQPCTITEIYINIVRFCLQRNSNNPKTKHLNPFIKNKRKEILSLAEAAFNATEGKTVNLTELPSEDSCVLSFLKPLFTKVGPTKTKTTHAFLHYTMQEFFAALWLLKNPDKIKDVFQQCLTEEKKHMKHLIPFMCCLLNEKSPSLTKCLIPAEELKNTSDWFFKEMITTFFTCPCEADTEDSGPDVDILFLCQCLYESQCPEACIHLLDKLGYHLDLSGESLDPLPCCAVAYVVTQSEERKVSLNLEDVRVSDQGMRRLFGCLKNVQWRDPLPLQLWKIFLLSEGQMDHLSLLGLDGNQLHLPVEGKRCLFEQAVKVMQKMSMKVNVCLHWDRETRVCQDLCESLFEALSYISSLSFRVTCRGPGLQDQKQHHGTLERKEKQLLLDLCLKAALHKGESFHNVVNTLLLLFSVNTGIHDILLDFYQHVKTGGFLSIIPLKPLFQSAPAVWVIDLSERKTSILLEVLKLQSEKKQVELRGWSDEESEVRSFLQCLPYISQLSFSRRCRDSGAVKVCGNLFCAAAEREQQTGEKILELLSSLCSYQTFPLSDRFGDDDYQSDFLLDLCSHLKDYETQTGLSVLPSVQSVFQSAPAVWVIDLSERKTSILLEVLKLQSEKKQVELTGWSDEESEVRSFLQCVPYISQLSFSPWGRDSGAVKVCGNLFCAAAEREQQTGEKILELLSSLCSYQTFPWSDRFDEVDDDDKYQSDFLLDLCSHLKDYETQTGLSVLPSVQSVFQSAPAVWVIDLSKRKPSILLEVLKLQSEKKQVELTGWSDEESEVRSFLQCLPYISQLSFSPWCRVSGAVKVCGNLFCAAAEREQQTGEKILELLSSLCSYQTFPWSDRFGDDDNKYQSDFLLDLYSHLKDYETQTGLSVLPSVQSVFQSAPAVWVIDLSERKPSILLEVLKLQSEKKQVELRGWSDEESEVRSFLQCVPYISQLSFSRRCRDSGAVKVCGNLFCAAAEREQQTGEKILELLSSLCSYQTFPWSDRFDEVDDDDKYQSDFLLDLYSHLKDYETQTGLSVLPSVQSVFQSAPAVWVIDLSERKPSILLEVLKLQSEKKQVELRGWSDEESEVRSFLQCVPYISQLSCGPEFFQRVCTLMSVRSREEAEQLASLLQLLGFTLLLTGELHLNTCRTVGRVLVLCGSDANLILTPRKISVRGASVLFRRTTRLHSLRLSNDMALLLCRWVRGGRVVCPVTVEELSLSPQRAKPSERVLLKVVSNVASLLRCWTVRRLDLTEFCVPAQGVIPLLLHDGPLTVKLSEEIFQQLLFLLHEIQDEDLTQFFLSKVGGDLTSCCVNWELLHYLLQQSSSQTFTVDLRKNSSLQRSITRLLPFLHRIVFKRLSPSFVLTAIREIYAARASPIIPSLLRSFDHVINLSCREMDSVDCAALLFTLRHSVRVKLNLLWSSIPAGQTESILFTLDRVSQLSADRSLLLRLVHCCAASDVQQGAAAVDLLRTVQHRLDLSCSSCVELDQRETLSLTAGDCRAVSAVLRHSSQDTQVILQDCEVEDSGLDLLFPVLNRVRLRASKAVLLQLVSLVPVNSERDTVRRAVSLCRALGGELDFSHSTLDQRACGALALMLDSCEELTELDLSHCRLTDQLLLMLSAHLHKVQVLDLSHNNVTDASTDTLLQLVSTNPSIHTVRLFGNKIVDRTCFDKHKFETW
ncbi:uncharacterized protein LOC125884800 isoform X2 [Epinephelus fuscoguttatus]|uniref:uncharacterized protein LOC125884800 isoform X2 n=1 Tax=Epinephelus fuscoguttatus TaxID=293821 RepID=UPI0020D12500|nr:uncharacterized protein LOC125884800 isoform X2 [Epinephelus fuscoguttatus]